MEVFKRLAKPVWNRYLRYFVMMIQRSQLYKWHFSRWKKILQLVREVQPKTIMEIGIGNGKSAKKIITNSSQARKDSDIEYYGFDFFETAPIFQDIDNMSLLQTISSEFIPPDEEVVRKRLQETGAQVNLFKGDIRETFPNTIEYLPKMDLVIIDCGPSYELLKIVYESVKRLFHLDTVVLFEGYPCFGVKKVIDQIDDCHIDIIHQPLDRMDIVVVRLSTVKV